MALRRKFDNSIAHPRRDRLTRSEFLKAHVAEIAAFWQSRCRFGYLHWSITDNYEWGSYTPRFGLFSIDFTNHAERLAVDHLGDRPSETYARLVAQCRSETAELSLPRRNAREVRLLASSENDVALATRGLVSREQIAEPIAIAVTRRVSDAAALRWHAPESALLLIEHGAEDVRRHLLEVGWLHRIRRASL